LADFFVAGLDLGQASDPSAFAVLQRNRVEDNGHSCNRWDCRHLERWSLGTSYVAIVEDVRKRFENAPLKHASLALDLTGIGRAVYDVFRQAQIAARLRPITITAGASVTVVPLSEGGGFNVPKKELVSTLQVLLQQGRLKVASALAEAETLLSELQNFRVKVTLAANETFGSWRERDHDDLVLAVALAAWLGEREGSVGRILPSTRDARNAAERAPPGVFERRKPGGVFD